MLPTPILTFLNHCLCPSTAEAHDVLMVIEKSLRTADLILGLDLQVIVVHLGVTPKGKDRRLRGRVNTVDRIFVPQGYRGGTSGGIHRTNLSSGGSAITHFKVGFMFALCGPRRSLMSPFSLLSLRVKMSSKQSSTP